MNVDKEVTDLMQRLGWDPVEETYCRAMLVESLAEAHKAGLNAAAQYMLSRRVTTSEFYAKEIRALARE